MMRAQERLQGPPQVGGPVEGHHGHGRDCATCVCCPGGAAAVLIACREDRTPPRFLQHCGKEWAGLTTGGARLQALVVRRVGLRMQLQDPTWLLQLLPDGVRNETSSCRWVTRPL